MLIRSDFKDYYDCAQVYGQDRSLIYNRFPKTIELPHLIFPQIKSSRLNTEEIISVKDFCIGFCGEVFHFIYLEHIKWTWDISRIRQIRNHYNKYCTSIEEIDQFVLNHSKKNDGYFKPQHRSKIINYGNIDKNGLLKNIELSKQKLKENNKIIQDIFIDHYCPVFCANTQYNKDQGKNIQTVELNCTLNNIDFAKKYDPYQAYQRIAMFLGNMAVPLKPIPHIDDKTMRDIKGFDKFSFKKEKSK